MLHQLGYLMHVADHLLISKDNGGVALVIARHSKSSIVDRHLTLLPLLNLQSGVERNIRTCKQCAFETSVVDVRGCEYSLTRPDDYEAHRLTKHIPSLAAIVSLYPPRD